jgi:hypothetical protein
MYAISHAPRAEYILFADNILMKYLLCSKQQQTAENLHKIKSSVIKSLRKPIRMDAN